MKIGDLVMFNDEGRYAKWFYGRLAIAESVSQSKTSGKWHCRVKWLEPVKYHDRHTTVSDFAVSHFEVQHGN
jgi:hypothetical protein